MLAIELARLTLGLAETYYRDGLISQVEYESYRRAWAEECWDKDSSNARGWLNPSSDPTVEQLCSEIIAVSRENRARS